LVGDDPEVAEVVAAGELEHAASSSAPAAAAAAAARHRRYIVGLSGRASDAGVGLAGFV
jgi:hypothetical protein